MSDEYDLNIAVLCAAWNAETSASPEEWSKANPSRGQCAITACVIQDALEGRLIRCVVTYPDGREESHYANLLANDVIYDLTASQFPEGCEFGPWEERTREYVLGYPATLARYNLYVQRIEGARVALNIQEGGVPAT